MKFDRPKLKSGFSLAAVVISMSLLAAVVGYFLGNWMIQYVTAPDDNIKNVSSEKVVSEEQINTSELDNTEKNPESSSALPEEAVQDSSKQQDQPGVEQNSTDNLFVVQVGAFDNHNNAKGLVEKLKARGYSAYITSQNPYKVQVGAFKERKKAVQLSDKLKKDGFPVYISH